MKNIVFGFFIAMIVSFLSTAIYLGYYKSVNFEIAERSGIQLLYTENVGPYHLINEKIEKVEQWAKENNISCPRSFGLYLDNPEKIDANILRSQVGCVLTKSISIELPEFLKQRQLDIKKAVIARFEGSPALAPLKVYPKAKDWFEKNQLSYEYSLEIYTILGDNNFSSEFLFPIPMDKLVGSDLVF